MKPPQTDQIKKALIYCRVSSSKQVREGHGLESQETRCRQYAHSHGYDVEAVFPDDVSSGGDFMKRPGMVSLLKYLDRHSQTDYVVIFDDLKRFARDTEFHIKLRRAFKVRGATVECLNFKFEDTPEGKFIETILAAQGALEREQNGRQVTQKMQARMMNGYWVFQAPLGYKFETQAAHGKIMVRDEPLASTIQEGLEGYASGRFETQAEVMRFFQDQPHFPKNRYGLVTQERTTHILTHPLYAGYIHHPDWNINWVQGQHEGLITLQCFETIKKHKEAGAMAPARKNISEDFPLRGFVLCADCDQPLTAGWSKGKNKKYPYYLCDTKGCDSYRKSIRRADIEGEFGEIVRSLQPSQQLFALAKAMFKNLWDQRLADTKATLKHLQRERTSIEKQINDLVERIIEASNARVIAAYEAKIEKLEIERRVIDEKLANSVPSNDRYGKFIEHALTFLASPWNIWESGQFTLKQLVLRLAFCERLAYCRKTGYRTPQTTLPFKVLEGFCAGKNVMVEAGGIEPPSVSSPPLVLHV